MCFNTSYVNVYQYGIVNAIAAMNGFNTSYVNVYQNVDKNGVNKNMFQYILC